MKIAVRLCVAIVILPLIPYDCLLVVVMVSLLLTCGVVWARVYFTDSIANRELDKNSAHAASTEAAFGGSFFARIAALGMSLCAYTRADQHGCSPSNKPVGHGHEDWFKEHEAYLQGHWNQWLYHQFPQS